MRRMELREVQQAHRRSVWPGTIDEIPKTSGMNWMINEGILAPSYEVKTAEELREIAAKADASAAGGGAKETEDGDDAQDGGDEEGEEGEQKVESLLALLYRPGALRTSSQKRSQIVLLKQLLFEMQCHFTKKFDDVFAVKEGKVDEIRTKNARIAAILEELKTEDNFFKPSFADDEFPERTVEVKDSEIPFERYISQEERKRMAEEEEERLRREAENQGDDAPKRALMDMMGGTLETAQDVSALDQELVREAWMDELLFEEMSDEQKKEVEEFEAKQKALLEEKEKYRKGLELELKKLKTEVLELCRNFDEQLAGLQELRVATQMMLYVQELYILRLAVSVSERDDDLKQLDSLRDLIAKHEVEHAGAMELLEAHRAIVAGVQGNLEEMRANERGMDKNFKREMNDMGITESDTLTMLTQLYKTPSSVKIGGWRQASDDHLLVKMSQQ